MCGIFGVTGDQEAAKITTAALARMAYRGYDSAGVATLFNHSFHRNRAAGKITALERVNEQNPLPGSIAIGHTRWATHGPAIERNAHPHISGRVVLVHNGVVDNHAELQALLRSKGLTPQSDTDSEIIALLINDYLSGGLSPVDACREAMALIEGTFALAFLTLDDADTLYAARRGSPLAIGHDNGRHFIGSCAIALAPVTQTVCYLEDEDIATIRPFSVSIEQHDGRPAARTFRTLDIEAHAAEKNGHAHFMSKEMHEQPEAVIRTLSTHVDLQSGTFLGALADLDFSNTRRILLIACGTSHYACQIAKYWLEDLAGIPVEVDIASEASGRSTPICERDTAIFVSQSGETADTLGALRHIKRKGARIISLVNVTESSLAMESDAFLGLRAQPEIGVASTKGFTCQLTLLLLVALKAGLDNGLGQEHADELLKALRKLPSLVAQSLKMEPELQAIGHAISTASSAFFIGRGTGYPLAMEGALKLKEISYIHAEGFAAGELKHGPIALIEEATPTIVLTMTTSRHHDKVLSSAQEISARHGPIYLVSDAAPDQGLSVSGSARLPETPDVLSPFVMAISVQLISYHAAMALGRDIDQPRNLAKAVTV